MSPPVGGAGCEQHLLLGGCEDGFALTLIGDANQFTGTHLFERIHQNPVVNHCLVQHRAHGGQLAVDGGYAQSLLISIRAKEAVLPISAQISDSDVSQFV